MNILNFLNDLGLTQQQLGDEIGTSNQNVNRWVTGKGVPSYDFCKKLLGMGMTVEDLFDIEYNKQHKLVVEEREPEQIKQDEFRLRWMQMMQEWNEEQKIRDGEL